MPIRHYSDLLLRPWSESDAPALRDAIDEDVDHLKPWLSWTLEEPATLERTRARLRDYVEQFHAGRAFRYAITPLDRPAVILGGAHLNRRVGPDAHDVGYWVRRSAVRQGIAAAAVSALVVHTFEERDVERLVIQCDVDNSASADLARALGFGFVGNDAGMYPDGRPRPLLRFELTRERFRRHHAATLRERARRVHLATGPQWPDDPDRAEAYDRADP